MDLKLMRGNDESIGDLTDLLDEQTVMTTSAVQTLRDFFQEAAKSHPLCHKQLNRVTQAVQNLSAAYKSGDAEALDLARERLRDAAFRVLRTPEIGDKIGTAKALVQQFRAPAPSPLN